MLPNVTEISVHKSGVLISSQTPEILLVSSDFLKHPQVPHKSIFRSDSLCAPAVRFIAPMGRLLPLPVPLLLLRLLAEASKSADHTPQYPFASLTQSFHLLDGRINAKVIFY